MTASAARWIFWIGTLVSVALLLVWFAASRSERRWQGSAGDRP